MIALPENVDVKDTQVAPHTSLGDKVWERLCTQVHITTLFSPMCSDSVC